MLAGVPFETFSKGPNTKRTDGDVVAHAIVMALAGATNTGDIDDWFPEKGETNRKSLEYLPEMRKRLIEPGNLTLGNIDVTVLCGEQPRMTGRSHLILETGSTSHTRTSRFTNLSCADVLYRPLENLDAIALPRMKKRVPEMQRNIAEGLGVDIDQVHVKVSSMDGHDEIAQLQGIEARVLISLWEGL